MGFEFWAAVVTVLTFVLGIAGALLGVHVRNETRAAVHEKTLQAIEKRLEAGDAQMEKLGTAIDRLRFTMERLVTIEEMRGNHYRKPNQSVNHEDEHGSF